MPARLISTALSDAALALSTGRGFERRQPSAPPSARASPTRCLRSERSSPALVAQRLKAISSVKAEVGGAVDNFRFFASVIARSWPLESGFGGSL